MLCLLGGVSSLRTSWSLGSAVGLFSVMWLGLSAGLADIESVSLVLTMQNKGLPHATGS